MKKKELSDWFMLGINDSDNYIRRMCVSDFDVYEWAFGGNLVPQSDNEAVLMYIESLFEIHAYVEGIKFVK